MLGARQVYLICKKMADDPTQVEHRLNVQRYRESGLGWRYDGLGSWSTEAIFARLQELGVDTDAGRFAKQARHAGRCGALEKQWLAGPSYRVGSFSDDFVFIASEELWERLTPELLCPELVSNRIEAAIGLQRGAGTTPTAPMPAAPMPADLAAALSMADYLQGFPRQIRAGRFEQVRDCGLHDYGWWACELILHHGGQYPGEVIRLADVLDDCLDERNIQSDLAMALAMAGWQEQAAHRVLAHLEAYPNDLWVSILAGDVYEELGDDRAAASQWVRSLSLAEDGAGWDAAADRLQDVLDRVGHADEWAKVCRSHPRPPGGQRGARAAPPMPLPSTGPADDCPVTPEPRRPGAVKVGRNDPCPCGSGRKYKKCCLR